MGLWNSGFGANSTHAPSDQQAAANDKTGIRVRAISSPSGVSYAIRSIAWSFFTQAASDTHANGLQVYRGPNGLTPEQFASLLASSIISSGWADPSGYELLLNVFAMNQRPFYAQFDERSLVAGPGQTLYVISGPAFVPTTGVLQATQTQLTVLGHAIDQQTLNIALR